MPLQHLTNAVFGPKIQWQAGEGFESTSHIWLLDNPLYLLSHSGICSNYYNITEEEQPRKLSISKTRSDFVYLDIHCDPDLCCPAERSRNLLGKRSKSNGQIESELAFPSVLQCDRCKWGPLLAGSARHRGHRQPRLRKIKMHRGRFF